jgi:hypothetical protein
MTLLSTLRAARPMVWISEVSLRRNVEALAQQVDADQRVERAQS